MQRRRAAVSLALLPVAALVGACGGTGLDLKPVASMSASNAFSPSGYVEKKMGDNQYQVGAIGTEATPKSRIEKIARARAAQIGVEEKLKFYKVTNVAFGIKCSKKHEFYKGGQTAEGSRPTVVLDVLYAKERVDPTYVSTQESFDTLNSELSSEVIPADAKAAAEQESRTTCGLPT